jgi:hypothetical protein
MATARNYICRVCGGHERAGGLFDALSTVAEVAVPPCTTCGSERKLELDFSLALGASGSIGTVVLVARSRQAWNAGTTAVEFFPFLVVIKPRAAQEEAVWLPYWHRTKDVAGTIRLKYGQWAPFMDGHLMNDLLQQAKNKGWVPRGRVPAA